MENLIIYQKVYDFILYLFPIANVYLNELDHFVKEILQVKFYIRYMDDFVLLYDDKKILYYWKTEIESFLKDKLCLSLNTKTSIFPISQGIDFLGYRTWATHRLIRKSSFIRMRRKLKRFVELYRQNKITLKRVFGGIPLQLIDIYG